MIKLNIEERQCFKNKTVLEKWQQSEQEVLKLINAFCKKFKLKPPIPMIRGWQIQFEWEDISIILPLLPYGTESGITLTSKYEKESKEMWDFIIGGSL